MTTEEGHGWSMRKSHLHLQHWEPSAAEVSKLLRWVLRGLSSSFIRLSPSWDDTRLLFQFSSTKPCRLLWGVSPPPFWLPLFSPSSLHLWPFSAQAQMISVTLPKLFQQRGTEVRSQGDEQKGCDPTPWLLGFAKSLGSGFSNSSVVSGWACSRSVQLPDG